MLREKKEKKKRDEHFEMGMSLEGVWGLTPSKDLDLIVWTRDL